MKQSLALLTIWTNFLRNFLTYKSLLWIWLNQILKNGPFRNIKYKVYNEALYRVKMLKVFMCIARRWDGLKHFMSKIDFEKYKSSWPRIFKNKYSLLGILFVLSHTLLLNTNAKNKNKYKKGTSKINFKRMSVCQWSLVNYS